MSKRWALKDWQFWWGWSSLLIPFYWKTHIHKNDLDDRIVCIGPLQLWFWR